MIDIYVFPSLAELFPFDFGSNGSQKAAFAHFITTRMVQNKSKAHVKLR